MAAPSRSIGKRQRRRIGEGRRPEKVWGYQPWRPRFCLYPEMFSVFVSSCLCGVSGGRALLQRSVTFFTALGEFSGVRFPLPEGVTMLRIR
jgi:hypothetical protein